MPQTLNIRFYTDFPTCNFKCDYCVAGHGSMHAKGESQWDAQRYHKIIHNIMRLPHKINIRIGVGGEFFISKELAAGAQLLSHSDNIYALNLITNLSFSQAQYEKILAGFDHSKLALVASFHPTEVKNHEEWLERAVAMRKTMDLAVIMVATPSALPLIRDVKHYLNERGVPVFLQSMLGSIGGKAYPQSYTQEEREEIRRLIYSRHDYEYLVNAKKPGLCNAGFKAIYVTAKGIVYPCGMGIYDTPLGNLSVSPHLTLNDSAQMCPFKSCICDTENQNTHDFTKHYRHTGRNQHIYEYQLKEQALSDPAYDEWSIPY